MTALHEKNFLIACLCYVFTTCIERVFKETVPQTIMHFIETQRKWVNKACKLHMHGPIRCWKKDGWIRHVKCLYTNG